MKPSNRRKRAILRRDRGLCIKDPFKDSSFTVVYDDNGNKYFELGRVEGYVNRHPITRRQMLAEIAKNAIWEIEHALSDCCGRGYNEYGEKVIDA